MAITLASGMGSLMACERSDNIDAFADVRDFRFSSHREPDGPQGPTQRTTFWRPFAPCFASLSAGQTGIPFDMPNRLLASSSLRTFDSRTALKVAQPMPQPLSAVVK